MWRDRDLQSGRLQRGLSGQAKLVSPGILSLTPAKSAGVLTSLLGTARDGAITEIDSGKPEGVWVSEQIGRPAVTAWNAVLAVTLAGRGQPKGVSGRIAIPVAGDDPKSKATAIQLVEATGFDALDTGSLSDSWRQRPDTPAYCTELTMNVLKSALRSADRSRAPGNRDALLREFMAGGGELTHDEIIARNRAVTA